MIPFLNPTAIKFLAAAIALVVAFIFGWRQGSLNVKAQWSKEKAELNAQAIQQINEANAQVLATEHKAQNDISNAALDYNKKIQRIKNEKNRALDDILANGLYINTSNSNGKDGLPNATASTSGSDATQRFKLSEKDARFFVELASEADEIAKQLEACQAILEAERLSF
jgi:prophage endopeptidase